MKLANLKATVGFIMISLALMPVAQAGDLFLNFFRNPSIGVEYRIKYISTHTGLYTTAISKDENDNYVSTEFIRTGISIWPTKNIYVSVSHLYGLTRDWKDKTGSIYDAGVEFLVWDERVALRLGIGVIPSNEYGTKVNPTPGIGLRIPL